MTEHLTIDVQHADGRIETCSIDIDDECQEIVFAGCGWHARTFSGPDLFEALRALRAALAPARPLCAGARRDVWPSAMARDGGGRKAYVTRMGSPSRTADLVDIFARAPAEEIASVDEQAAFHDRWAASLG